jgi:glyoxylase-like metal-dependent hydrolase (beta-lactamase superfamily II)
MTIHILNCFSCDARVPSGWRTGTLCLLAETSQGPVLIDTGPGLDDYVRPPGILRVFQVITKVAMDVEETACRQVARLGYSPQDVQHVVLTHMHFDHCGGLRDFPAATVHVHQREYEAFMARPRQLADLAYVRRHTAHHPRFSLYGDQGESWYGLPAIRLPFDPEMWLVPLFGHTRGHCGVTIRTKAGWHFHVADAGPVALEDYAPAWLVGLVLGPHTDRLRAFAAEHSDVQITTGHMWLDYFHRQSIQDEEAFPPK